ncbi:GntR family transcriptional regulator [Neiella marina]|uniref:GntR family transcriptional regulator n=1 Tax=Neiella holothuriorum TaxID=2870530 RepID=A0ABS7EGN8_9GAMM|nr:S1-like domain-containing RNA-binding protein [Neiella holothuriorum]MBW8190961.1 GntR family transcriptional regulator [Neiella holothuriorum]
MIRLGQMNRLTVAEKHAEGWLLVEPDAGDDANTDDAVLLAAADAPEELAIDDSLSVFVFVGPEQQLQATTSRPKVLAGQLALLKAKQASPYGMFMDWGMSKDLLVPNREQYDRMDVGESYLVYVYVDEQQRLAASSRYKRYIDQERHAYRDGDKVHLTITEQTPLGYNCVVDYLHSALLYQDQVFRSVKRGDQITGYVRQVREDGLLDVSTQEPGYGKISGLTDRIMQRLEQSKGELKLSDKSSPEMIKSEFQCSKKAFKQAIGSLRKQQLIEIFPDHIKRR